MSPLEKKLIELKNKKVVDDNLVMIIDEIIDMEKEMINNAYHDGYMDKERNKSFKYGYYNQKFNYGLIY
jgi:predicted DNA binding protein